MRCCERDRPGLRDWGEFIPRGPILVNRHMAIKVKSRAESKLAVCDVIVPLPAPAAEAPIIISRRLVESGEVAVSGAAWASE